AGSEFFDPGPDPGGPGYPNHLAATIAGGGVTINSVTFLGPTNLTLNVTVSSNAATGPRTLTVINPDGRGVNSASGLLTILGPPGIVAPPQNLTVAAGDNPVFNVTASGTEPVRYQWRFNGADLSDATNSSLALINVQCADAGNYDVMLTNDYGSVTSSLA